MHNDFFVCGSRDRLASTWLSTPALSFFVVVAAGDAVAVVVASCRRRCDRIGHSFWCCLGWKMSSSVTSSATYHVMLFSAYKERSCCLRDRLLSIRDLRQRSHRPFILRRRNKATFTNNSFTISSLHFLNDTRYKWRWTRWCRCDGVTLYERVSVWRGLCSWRGR